MMFRRIFFDELDPLEFIASPVLLSHCQWSRHSQYQLFENYIDDEKALAEGELLPNRKSSKLWLLPVLVALLFVSGWFILPHSS